MKKKLFSTIALVCFAVAICLAVVADLTGKWTGKLQTPNGDLPVILNLKADGEVLTGTAESQAGSLVITDGKIKGTDFTFNLDLNGTPLKNTGKFYGDSVVLDVDYSGTNMHGVFKRAEEKK